jgi:hypothetical protein
MAYMVHENKGLMCQLYLDPLAGYFILYQDKWVETYEADAHADTFLFIEECVEKGHISRYDAFPDLNIPTGDELPW